MISITNTLATLNSENISDSSNLDKKAKELKEAAAGFEGMFLSMMIKTMRKASEEIESGLFKKSRAEEIFTDMLDNEYVTLATKSSSTGLGDTLYNYIIATTPEYKDLQSQQKPNVYQEHIDKLKKMKTDQFDEKMLSIDLKY